MTSCLKRCASLTENVHGKGQMPPYVTLGLVARKALPRSRAAKRNIDFVHTGWTDTLSYMGRYTESAGQTRTPGGRGQESGRRTLMPRGAGSHRHGAIVGATRMPYERDVLVDRHPRRSIKRD